MHTHPDNTLTHYITTLPQRINLSGQWECGLSEVIYPHSWYNVRESDTWFGIGLRNDDDEQEVSTTKTKIEGGYYHGPQNLVKAINRALGRVLPDNVVRLYYSLITHKITVMMMSNAILTGDMLKTILGFGDTMLSGDMTKKKKETIIDAEYVVDMTRGFESLYVYTSVIEPRIVGDSHVPLLRIVPVSGRQSDTVTMTFQKIQYIPVLCKDFDTVEIDIRDDTGRHVPFERGKLTTTLHFRRRRTALF
ncbi:hypothetical protein DJ031_00485 [bacterium endosymbiont of Escarpia laminata]|nr:MAG: hypothetical protein DJ031_00485 [bacterium endosymbiont of Escarpia laminata]